MNKEIMKATIKFLKLSKRFNGPIIWTFLKNVLKELKSFEKKSYLNKAKKD